MKKRYIIKFSGMFEYGFLIFQWWSIRLNQTQVEMSYEELRATATRFRFKWFADMYCKLMNSTSNRKLDLRTWSVEEIEVDKDRKEVDRFNREKIKD